MLIYIDVSVCVCLTAAMDKRWLLLCSQSCWRQVVIPWVFFLAIVSTGNVKPQIPLSCILIYWNLSLFDMERTPWKYATTQIIVLNILQWHDCGKSSSSLQIFFQFSFHALWRNVSRSSTLWVLDVQFSMLLSTEEKFQLLSIYRHNRFQKFLWSFPY